jgi:hypothetical protein
MPGTKRNPRLALCLTLALSMLSMSICAAGCATIPQAASPQAASLNLRFIPITLGEPSPVTGGVADIPALREVLTTFEERDALRKALAEKPSIGWLSAVKWFLAGAAVGYLSHTK